jgi:hypothetical protein
MRRRFSFALLLVLDVGIQLQADRDQPPADRRTRIRRPRPAVRHPRRPMSLGAPAYRVNPTPPADCRQRRAAAGPRLAET